MLELLALIAAALVFQFFIGGNTVSLFDNGAGEMKPVGNVVTEMTEGVVVSINPDSLCLSENGDNIEFYCATPSAKYQLKGLSVGDVVNVIYFDEGDSDPHPYHVYAIDKRYKDPPSRIDL